MNQKSIKSNIQAGFALATVTTLSLALIGGTSASAMQANNVNGNKAAVATSKESKAATDFRKALNGLLQDHVTTNLVVNRAIVSGASEAEIALAEQSQLANTASLSAAIESIYGSAAAAEFSEMFNEHIEESNNIAQAVADGDAAAKAEAVVELEEYLVEITAFFVTAIPILPYDAVFGLLEQHEELINLSTEAAASGNFGQSKRYEQQALRQISVIADALASGIISTQPAKF